MVGQFGYSSNKFEASEALKENGIRPVDHSLNVKGNKFDCRKAFN